MRMATISMTLSEAHSAFQIDLRRVAHQQIVLQTDKRSWVKYRVPRAPLLAVEEPSESTPNSSTNVRKYR